ncbi:MAG: NUDIX hydrolase [Gemmatimonadota bacterium]
MPEAHGDRIEGERVYRGRILDVDLDRVRFPDGSVGELEIIRHPGASAVLPLYRSGEWSEGEAPAVVLLRHYRYAGGGALWEVPAGKLYAGEDPEACARRELEEEAGLRARSMRRLTSILTTPGFTDEVIHLFVAVGLEPGRMRHESSEFIERHELALDRALDMIRDGEIRDAKTICTLLYAATFGGEPGSFRENAVDTT